MQVIQLCRHGKPGEFRLTELPQPTPGEDEAVIRVKACGLNRLDLWLEEGTLPIKVALPRIPGGEIAGEIVSLGSKISSAEWRVGDPVVVQSNLFCGKCEFCLAGEETLCLSGQLIGVDRDGGFAEQVAVPARTLVRMPEGVNPVSAAAMTLAGSTAMHMLTDRCQVRSGQWVLVIGAASGVGSAAIQIAHRLGAYVIATGSSEAKRNLAVQLGATATIDSTREDWPDEVRRLTDRHGADLVVEHVGGTVLEQAFRCLARGGTIVTCGATAEKQVQVNLWPFFVKQQRLVGSYGRTRSDIAATLSWLHAGKLKPVVHQTLPLSETSKGFAQLRRREVLGKVVIVPAP